MPSEEFKEVAVVIESKEGICMAPITVRETTEGKKFSFAPLREFERAGEKARTCWFFKRHINSLRRLLDDVENWFEKQEALERKTKK